MIGLMDCNNFFVSCERLFRPDLRKKPVAVLSSNDGCIVARSQEVKDLGIPMGIPHFQVKNECIKHNITLFSSNFTLYRDISNRVMSALKAEFDMCEIYSIDEAFFDVPKHMSENDIIQIRARIMAKTGIPVSIGVAETKTIAKTASVFAKKSTGVCMWDKNDWKEFVGEVSCGSVWGIGRQTTKKLTELGILTVGDIISYDRAFFQQNFGVVGERLWFELSGTPVYFVGDDSVVTENQSISSTRSFSKELQNKMTLLSALSHHVTHVGEKLRSHHWVASKLTIIAAPSRFGDFAGRTVSASSTLEFPTSNTSELIKEAVQLLDSLYDKNVPYKKVGVTVSGIAPEATSTQTLFGTSEIERHNLSKITDSINERFGSGTVRSGFMMGNEKWSEKKLRKSPEYTTRWNQIQMVKAI